MASEIPDLVALERTGTGKGAARRARREGYVPGVVVRGGRRSPADQPRIQRPAQAPAGRPLPRHAPEPQGRGARRRSDHLPRRAARRGEGRADPCRLPPAPPDVAHQPLHPRRDRGRGGRAGPQEGRRADDRAPRDRTDGDGGRHPREGRGLHQGYGDRRHAHGLLGHAAGGEPRGHRARLRDRQHPAALRPRLPGRGGGRARRPDEVPAIEVEEGED